MRISGNTGSAYGLISYRRLSGPRAPNKVGQVYESTNVAWMIVLRDISGLLVVGIFTYWPVHLA